MNPAVFLDRDNTIIHNDGDLGDPAGVRLIQGAATAIASLCGLGYKVVVVSNQGGVARGKYSEADVHAVHQRISELIDAGANGARIDRFYYCPYHPEGTVSRYRKEHPSRKPAPGMLLEAARDMDLDLSQSWTIGDQVRDVQAGLAAGTRAILLRHDADQLEQFDPAEHSGLSEQRSQQSGDKATPDFYVRNLVEAVRIVAQQRTPETADSRQRPGEPKRMWDAAAVAKLRQEQHPAPGARQSKPGDDAPGATATATRPFKPWNAPESVDEDQPDTVSTATATEKPKPPADPAAQAPAQPAAAPKPTAAAKTDQPDADEKTLRLILQELRNQRGVGAEFSYLKIMAIVMQTVAGACLLGALWLGGGDDFLFQRLIGVAVLAQLAVIAALLWER